MREFGVLKAKTHLSALVADVERGDEVLVTRHGRPVARISSPAPDPRTPREELAERLQAFRARLVRENPALAEPESWDELKAVARR